MRPREESPRIRASSAALMFPVDEFARKSIAAASALLSSTVVVRLLGWAGKGGGVDSFSV